MTANYNNNNQVPHGVREKLNHFKEDLELGIIDMFTVSSALYHMGYIVVGKTELYEYSDRIKEEVDNAHHATTRKMCQKTHILGC